MRTLLHAGALAGALAVIAVPAACSTRRVESGDHRMIVVTTTTQLTDFATVIAGGHARVIGLIKANVDPHDYEPTAGDLEALSRAAVIVRNGVGLERWFDSTIRSAESKAVLVDASSGVAVHDHDPHIWLDVHNAERMVATIEAAMADADPANAAVYGANLARYNAELSRLDTEIVAKTRSLANRKLVTNHDAFEYYVDRYGFEFVGAVIPSFDTSSELSPGQIGDLVAKIRHEGVKAVFSEQSLPPKTAAVIAREAGVRVIDGRDALFVDALGPPGSGADTYLSMMRHNTDTIVANLR